MNGNGDPFSQYDLAYLCFHITLQSCKYKCIDFITLSIHRPIYNAKNLYANSGLQMLYYCCEYVTINSRYIASLQCKKNPPESFLPNFKGYLKKFFRGISQFVRISTTISRAARNAVTHNPAWGTMT